MASKKNRRYRFRINKEGRWLHESVEIKKSSMVKLFSSLLKVENGQYFLVTPNEKWQIQVDIAPFFIIDAQRMSRQVLQVIMVKAKTGEEVLLGRDNPIIMQKFFCRTTVTPSIYKR